jgi:hypothetical protein
MHKNITAGPQKLATDREPDALGASCHEGAFAEKFAHARKTLEM